MVCSRVILNKSILQNSCYWNSSVMSSWPVKVSWAYIFKEMTFGLIFRNGSGWYLFNIIRTSIKIIFGISSWSGREVKFLEGELIDLISISLLLKEYCFSLLRFATSFTRDVDMIMSKVYVAVRICCIRFTTFCRAMTHKNK